MEKESGDRVRAERIAREEGDEIDGIDRYRSIDVVLPRSRSGANEEETKKIMRRREIKTQKKILLFPS